MKNIWLIGLCLFASLVLSCSGTSLTPVQDAMKRNHPFADVPKNIRNSKPDPHFADEKAIVVTLMFGKRLFVGDEEFSIEMVGAMIDKLLEKNPSEKQLIYLNADANAEYGDVVQALDIVRRSNAESVGLIVQPATGADKKLQVLKTKYSPEPQIDDPLDLLDERLVINLQKDGKIKLGRFDKYAFKASGAETAEAEIGGKLAQMLKENEEKKITLKGASEIDRTIFVKASRSKRYGEVARLVDAANGAGAAEVYLVLDDLD